MKSNYLIFLIIQLLMINSSYSNEEIDFFILAGQSNAQGWTGDATFYPTDPNNLDNQIRLNSTYIGHSSSNGWVTMKPQEGLFSAGHFGPEVTLSRKLLQAGYNPAFFKFCKGGTSIYDDWKTRGEGGYYDDMITALSNAITDLENQGHKVNIRAFIWIQGESDAKEILQDAYYENLLSIINDLRNNVFNHASLPIILGVDEQHGRLILRPTVLNAHLDIAKNDDHISFSSMVGFEKADGTHLTPTGLEAHGEQLFNIYSNLISDEIESSSCTIGSQGDSISSTMNSSWGQSFKPNCSGSLNEIHFNSATNLSSPVTISISNGSNCNATLIHSQTINSMIDGNNVIQISEQIHLNKEHTYFINISSDLNEDWKVRYNPTSQIYGSLKTYENGQSNSSCDRNFTGFDLNFLVVINEESPLSYVHLRKVNAQDYAIDGGNGGGNNAPIKLWNQNKDNMNQHWVEIYRGDGYYSYRKRDTNYCLDGNDGGSTGQLLRLFDCSATNENQHWKKISLGNDKYRFEKRNAPSFGIDGGNAGTNNQQLKLWGINPVNENQQWILSYSNENTTLSILSPSTQPASLFLYPNAANEKITIQGLTTGTYSITMYDILGKQHMQKTITDKTAASINIQNLSDGLYLMTVQGGKISQTLKFNKRSR